VRSVWGQCRDSDGHCVGQSDGGQSREGQSQWGQCEAEVGAKLVWVELGGGCLAA